MGKSWICLKDGSNKICGQLWGLGEEELIIADMLTLPTVFHAIPFEIPRTLVWEPTVRDS